MNAAGPVQSSPAELKDRLRAEAVKLGFDVFGVTTPDPAEKAAYLERWLAEGRHAGMAWMERDPERRENPEHVLPGVRSLVCVGINCFQKVPDRRGRIATYSLGGDYHKLFNSRLKQLCVILRELGGANRPYADTGPVLEKPLCARAGLGWQGRHTGLVNERFGGWLMLGVILTTLELPLDAPARNRCGSCRRCLDACPTGALTGPQELDARRCISYLTIEHKGAIPEELRPRIGDHLFGCDECIAVCPWNRHAVATREARFAPRPLPDPAELLRWTEAHFDEVTAGMAMRRTGFERMKRNACVVMGNIGTTADLPTLREALRDKSALVAEHAAWAIRTLEKRLRDKTTEAFPG